LYLQLLLFQPKVDLDDAISCRGFRGTNIVALFVFMFVFMFVFVVPPGRLEGDFGGDDAMANITLVDVCFRFLVSSHGVSNLVLSMPWSLSQGEVLYVYFYFEMNTSSHRKARGISRVH
jgi:hypothetical protein